MSKQRLSASVDASVHMRAFDAFLRHYEGKHGVITDDEIREASRRARENAFVVRGKKFDRATRVSK